MVSDADTWTWYYSNKKELRVAKSSLAAKTLALIEDFDNALYIASLQSEILMVIAPITYYRKNYIGNKSLIDAIQLAKYVNNSRLRIDISAVKEIIYKNIYQKLNGSFRQTN